MHRLQRHFACAESKWSCFEYLALVARACSRSRLFNAHYWLKTDWQTSKKANHAEITRRAKSQQRHLFQGQDGGVVRVARRLHTNLFQYTPATFQRVGGRLQGQWRR